MTAELGLLGLRFVAINQLDTRLAVLRSKAPTPQGQLLPGPIRVVAHSGEPDRYLVVDGFKRLEASRDAGDERVLVQVEPSPTGLPSETIAKILLLESNAPRRTLSPMDEARVVHSLIADDGQTQRQVASLLCRRKSWVSKRYTMARELAEPVIRDVDAGRIGTSVAEEAQVDWSPYKVVIGGVLRVIHCFSMILCYSRYMFIQFHRNERLQTLLAAHVAAFQFFRGVCRRLVYDNMSQVTYGRRGNKPLWNPLFLAFAQHWAFEPWACWVNHPDRKGKVERPFEYIASSFLAERSFASWEELGARRERRIARALKRARFGAVKSLAEFDFTRRHRLSARKVKELTNCQFITEGRSIICVGKSGTEKTHIAKALGHAACLKGYSVLSANTADLLDDLHAALADKTYDRVFRRLVRVDLVICNELGYLPLDRTKADHLFRLISARHPDRSMIVTTNTGFSDWGSFFPNEAQAVATVDRLLDRATVLRFTGESFREPREILGDPLE